ncbi:MAG: S-methyl-5-thioribose-1-phosphate isomerase [Anaerolineales bacterium]
MQSDMRTLEWDEKEGELRLIDQRLLPGRFEIVTCASVTDVIEAIRNMTVRGAPAIGVAAAYGMALAARQLSFLDVSTMRAELYQMADKLQAARPTAVNLSWAIQRAREAIDQPVSSTEELREKLLSLARAMAEEDVQVNLRLAQYGASLIEDGDTILHHCNTGALATVDWGTALGAIRMAHEQGKRVHVLVDETRPRLQGARLTAWELQQYGIPFEIISDGAAGYFLRSGQVQKVFFGADRVAANGDVANKVGTYMLALAAHINDVPVYSVFPTSSVDLSLQNGDLIPIEERDEEEVLGIQVQGQPATPAGARARNPAFDVTPHTLITALVTEKGIVYPPFRQHLPEVLQR